VKDWRQRRLGLLREAMDRRQPLLLRRPLEPCLVDLDSDPEPENAETGRSFPRPAPLNPAWAAAGKPED